MLFIINIKKVVHFISHCFTNKKVRTNISPHVSYRHTGEWRYNSIHF